MTEVGRWLVGALGILNEGICRRPPALRTAFKVPGIGKARTATKRRPIDRRGQIAATPHCRRIRRFAAPEADIARLPARRGAGRDVLVDAVVRRVKTRDCAPFPPERKPR